MKKYLYYSILLTIILSASISCSKKESSIEPTSPVSTLEPQSVNPFGATIGGSIQNYSIGEITRGEIGILLSEAPSDQSQDQSIFLEWKNTGNTNGINLLRASYPKSGTNFFVEINKLKPGTPYLTCAFFIDKNGERMIGNVIRFVTAEAELQAVTERVESPGYINANICGTVRTNIPLENLSYGIIWSETPGKTTIDAGNIVACKKKDDQNGNYSVNVNYLHAGRKYSYRSYACYDNQYFYGDEMEFTTRNADEMAVDLGLSVLWADCNLGANSWEEEGLALAWGELTENGIGSQGAYKYFVDGQYVFLGNEISGTEYDAAHVYLGGKWRMPTREEIYEMLASCNVGFTNNALSHEKLEDATILVTAENNNTIWFSSNRIYGNYIVGDNTEYRSYKSFTIGTGTFGTIDDDFIRNNTTPAVQRTLSDGSCYCSFSLQFLAWHTSGALDSAEFEERHICVPIRPVRDRD